MLECLLGVRVVEHLLEGLLEALGLLDLRHRKIAQCVEVRGRRGLYLLDDRLELRRRPASLSPRKRGHFRQGPWQATSPMPLILRPLRYARIQSRKCWMPTIRMASSTYGSKSVSKPEANMSRRPLSKTTNRASRRPVFCTSFGSDFFSISPNRRASRARLLLVARLDGQVRGHLRDDPVAVALARLFGNASPTLFLAGTHNFPITLCSGLV